MPVLRPKPFADKLILDRHQCQVYAAFVRGARNTLGLSQSTLADMVGVTRSTLVRLEKGEPPLKAVLCMATIDVLHQLGVEAQNLNLLAAPGGEPPSALELKVSFDMLWHTRAVLDLVQSDSELITALLGEDYVPLLAHHPLRRK